MRPSSWRSSGALPTTAAGAEVALLIAFLGLRIIDLVLLGLGTPVALSRSPRPSLAALVEVGFVAESIVVCVVCGRRRAYDDPRVAWLETAAGAVILLSSRWYTQPADRFSSWADWGYPVGLSVALGLGIGFRRWTATLTTAAVLAGCYLFTITGVTGTDASRATGITNATSFFTFAVVPQLLASYLRRLGQAADDSRSLALAQGEQLERLRQQALLHSKESTLRALARGEYLPGQLDLLRAQALDGAEEIRAFLDGSAAAPSGLAGALTEVTATFADLDATVNVELATRELPALHVETLAEAVRTLLENVRRHAGPSSVVVHAETSENGWEVTVADDGAGFDPASVPPRFGLRELVYRRVHAIDGIVEVRSAPGHGTLVRMSGPPP